VESEFRIIYIFRNKILQELTKNRDYIADFDVFVDFIPELNNIRWK